MKQFSRTLCMYLSCSLIILTGWSVGWERANVYGEDVPVSVQTVSAEDIAEFPTIKVTANKIEEDADKVPIPMTILQRQELTDRSINSFEDYFLQLPNLLNAPASIGDRHVSFRGFNPAFFTEQSAVMLVVDGMPLSQIRGLSLNFANVEQIEFLRGAQNTLFGQSAIGGVINVTTTKPTNDTRSYVEAYAGARNSYRADAQVNTPLVKDTLYLGLGFSHWRTDGFIRNVFQEPERTRPSDGDELNDERQNQFNINVRWYPTSNYSARLYLSRDERNYGQARAEAPIERAIDDRVSRVSHDIDGFAEFENNTAALNQQYTTSRFDIVSVSGVYSANYDQRWDNDFGSGDTVDGRPQLSSNDTLNVNQEFRLQSLPDDRVKWNVGTFFQYENRDIDQSFARGVVTPDSLIKSRKEVFQGALFGQVRIPVLETVGVTLGARGQLTQKEFKNNVFIGKVYAASPAQPSVTTNFNEDHSWFAFMPRALVDYQVTPDVMLWASYARGHTPGGFNFLDLSDGTFFRTTQVRFKSQKSNDFEVGMKSRWWDRRLQFNLNFFYIETEDYHTLEFHAGGELIAGNAAKVISKGVELESIVRLMPWLTLDAAIGINNAEFDRYQVGFANNTGNYVEDTPSHTVHMGLLYRLKPFMARIDWTQVGSIFFDNANTPRFKQSTYDLVNLRAGYESEHWAAYFTIENVMDTEYAIEAALINDPSGNVLWGNPRTIGGSLRWYW